MQIPSFLYGTSARVKEQCTDKLRALQGSSVDDLIDQWVDTKTTQGLFVVDGPSRLLESGQHFHVFWWSRIMAETQREKRRELLDATLDRTWLLLCYLGKGMMTLFTQDETAFRPFLQALLRWWPELTAEGARYTRGGNEGQQLWEVPSTLYQALGRSGLPVPDIQRALETGNVLPILEKAAGEA